MSRIGAKKLRERRDPPRPKKPTRLERITEERRVYFAEGKPAPRDRTRTKDWL